MNASPSDIMKLALASWETIYHRTVMMTTGTCSQAEYYSMMAEKASASQIALLALMTGQGQDAAMQPYLSAATANAKRLRDR